MSYISLFNSLFSAFQNDSSKTDKVDRADKKSGSRKVLRQGNEEQEVAREDQLFADRPIDEERKQRFLEVLKKITEEKGNKEEGREEEETTETEAETAPTKNLTYRYRSYGSGEEEFEEVDAEEVAASLELQITQDVIELFEKRIDHLTQKSGTLAESFDFINEQFSTTTDTTGLLTLTRMLQPMSRALEELKGELARIQLFNEASNGLFEEEVSLTKEALEKMEKMMNTLQESSGDGTIFSSIAENEVDLFSSTGKDHFAAADGILFNDPDGTLRIDRERGRRGSILNLFMKRLGG